MKPSILATMPFSLGTDISWNSSFSTKKISITSKSAKNNKNVVHMVETLPPVIQDVTNRRRSAFKDHKPFHAIRRISKQV